MGNHIKKHYKNSNTGELILRSIFEHNTRIDFPDHYYNIHGKEIGDGDEDIVPDLIGFVEISEKKYTREKKKQLKVTKND